MAGGLEGAGTMAGGRGVARTKRLGTLAASRGGTAGARTHEAGMMADGREEQRGR